jgi:hypothetical protein
MPKDATKNVDRYKIRGGTINEFEFTENQEQFSEPKRKSGGKLIPGTPPEKKTKKATKKAATVSAQGASAKKLAARKAARKK